MKLIIGLGILLIIIIVALALIQSGKINIVPERTPAQVTINDATYNVFLAETEEKRAAGLSIKKSLKDDQGMLFIFDQKGKPEFWMNGMKFPIDIIFINDNRVVFVTKNAPIPAEGQFSSSLPRYTPTENANYVLEVKAGEANKHNIKPGDSVEFKNVPQK